MSSKFESGVKQIPYTQQQVYAKLSNLENVEKAKARVPQEYIKDMMCDRDSVSRRFQPLDTAPACNRRDMQDESHLEGRHPLVPAPHGGQQTRRRGRPDCRRACHPALRIRHFPDTNK